MKHLKQKKGFTLVEVIVVLVIVGILLAITIPSIMGYVKKAEEVKFQTLARTANVKATEYIEKTLQMSSNTDFSKTVNQLRKDLSYNGSSKVSSIIGTDKVGKFRVLSVDVEFDNEYTEEGWTYNPDYTNHTITRISVIFTSSEHELPSSDSKIVVTVNNDQMYFYYTYPSDFLYSYKENYPIMPAGFKP